ncbi:MAG: aminotransferase class I/II-fold pyridoxal phosphate-dependent enzyme [Candidatus Eisenbacteria bacterium]|uniref:Aminotransferase class I/II-fold pyridoxal phosphate-dependent enzyme n=1 Tax=Eiseniibacteriota bacterium TaxID=2212470 RepID=A0A956M067_UNCEI|nr:aminotransferase class I/II-fold pyridoxal phosphate-dependent enzyme [Candidatus Eisenbacteria bacterium]
MSEFRPASRLGQLGTTIFAEMTQLAERHQAVNLSQGFPDFGSPEFLREAAMRAIREEHNQYARMRGEPVLVHAIAEAVQSRTGLEFDPLREITVFSGATEALHCAFFAFCDPGDEVVILEPYYDSYRAGASMTGAIPRFVPLRGPDFRWDSEELQKAFSDRTRMLVVNTPHNPCGRVFTGEELEELAALCRRYDVLCVADEVYDRIVYDHPHLSIATFDGMRERTITINSTGKTFSLTGWKIGYACAPIGLTDALAAVHQFVTFAVATPFQHAMAQALRAPASYFEDLVRGYRRRRDLLVNGLAACGFAVTAPQGAYFVLADIRPLGFDDDVAFCRHLVERVGVAAIPPTAFYEHKELGRHLVRFAFCKTDETITAALERLRQLPRKG